MFPVDITLWVGFSVLLLQYVSHQLLQQSPDNHFVVQIPVPRFAILVELAILQVCFFYFQYSFHNFISASNNS